MDNQEARVPDNPFKVMCRVFGPRHRDTEVMLKRGERLFVLTDRGLEEAPHKGPDRVTILTEDFNAWPVVAFAVPETAAIQWRDTQPADWKRMMKRVRNSLTTKDQPNG